MPAGIGLSHSGARSGVGEGEDAHEGDETVDATCIVRQTAIVIGKQSVIKAKNFITRAKLSGTDKKICKNNEEPPHEDKS